ncbi:MAG: 30S ribosomal protein S18 [Patescibacteria group bacterium]|nr:30S ribosomal protein S18 [Patescibacteria group bacterium]
MIKRKKFKKRKIDLADLKCPFTGPEEINYKDVYKLKRFVTTRGRVLSRSRTGVCKKCQRELSGEIKKARYMALLPFCNYS